MVLQCTGAQLRHDQQRDHLGPAMMVDVADTITLTCRPVVASVDELLAGCSRREPFLATTARISGSTFERIVIDGEPHILKFVHVDNDWTMRIDWRRRLPPACDLAGRPVYGPSYLTVSNTASSGWPLGLRHNGPVAILIPRPARPRHWWRPGDDPIPLADHRRLPERHGRVGRRQSGAGVDDRHLSGPVPLENRWDLGFAMRTSTSSGRPRIAPEPWLAYAAERLGALFERGAGRGCRGGHCPLRPEHAGAGRHHAHRRPVFLHGDWKLGNVGAAADGHTVLIDWTYPGSGPVAHDLAWYLALNRVRLPESKEDAIDTLGSALRGSSIDTTGWYERQVQLCLLSRRSFSSGGRRRSATTRSSAGGRTAPSRGSGCCERDRHGVLAGRRSLAGGTRPHLRRAERTPRRAFAGRPRRPPGARPGRRDRRSGTLRYWPRPRVPSPSTWPRACCARGPPTVRRRRSATPWPFPSVPAPSTASLAYSLNHLLDPVTALREVARVTAPGGPILAASYASDDRHPVKSAVNRAAAEAGFEGAGWYDRIHADAVPQLASVPRAESALRQAHLSGYAVHERISFPELGPRELVDWRVGTGSAGSFRRNARCHRP